MKKHTYTQKEVVKNYDLLRDLPEVIKLSYAKTLLDIVGKKSILDLGFGTGNVLIYLAKLNKLATIYGVDDSAEMFLATKQKLGGDPNLFCGKLSDFVKKYSKVDYLHFKAMLHCLKNSEELIDKIINSIKVGGAIITSHEISQTEDRIEQLFDYSGIIDKEVDSVFQKYFRLRSEMNLPFTTRKFPAGNSDYVSDYLLETGRFKKEQIPNENLSWKRVVRIIDILEATKKGTFGVFFDGISKNNREQIYAKLILFCTNNRIDIHKNRLLSCNFKINFLRKID